MEENYKKDYMQDAHLRYIIDHFSSEVGRIIISRKTYLIFKLGSAMLVSTILFLFLPNW